MAVDAEVENPILYEDLAALENDFDDAELEIRTFPSVKLSAFVY